MKIGKFANKNNLSIDTIRHYMDIALIIPKKLGGQYDFDERCQRDLEDILSFKGMGFTLGEIKEIFMFKRFGKLTPYQNEHCYREIFNNKYHEIEAKIIQLKHMKERLDDKIKKLGVQDNKKNFQIGIDFKALNLFRCLSCNGDLMLHEGNINNNQIINGKLRCHCGEEYIIEEGILILGNRYIHEDIDSDFDYIIDYINFTDEDYLSKMYETLEWANKRIDFKELKNKVILELGSGMGFFLRNIYKDLPEDILYIAVDHSIARHRFLKSMIEITGSRKNIVFICSDFLEIPIKEKSIDVVLDISGSSNYGFEKEEFLLKLIDCYVKEDAYLIGNYILFKNFTFNSFIEQRYRKNFILNNIKNEIKKLNYNLIEEKMSDYIDKGGKYESYFNEGERVYGYSFYGKR
ncbi:MerR family transcriptional regulator [Clostridium sp. MSJ-4]|uniref:MerR family transcriptional regulator n=1 Tax=Clostridium simiarum TaxID=2841506 RepID=A0ABS6F2Y5_9CLOT|nr:MerR family transcriptional regulator [Clostridium simiarum]MBU5592872.1 MerR family transcriptional regulator [Clostridium simiarum]